MCDCVASNRAAIAMAFAAALALLRLHVLRPAQGRIPMRSWSEQVLGSDVNKKQSLETDVEK
jgi:hypothetical protein